MGGRRKQSATGSLWNSGMHNLRAHGLIHRAVVVATYVQLDGPEAFPEVTVTPSAVYCDVLLYSTSEGLRGAPLRRVLVAQDCGMHDGKLWHPRAATQDFSRTAGLDPNVSDPKNLDGDHVLIQYMEDNLSLPVITKRLPHPRMGFGNEALASAGHRLKLKLVDGQPDYWKHHGSFAGFDKDGNFIVDTTRAHSGQYDVSGNEVPVPDAAHGNTTYVVSDKATFKVIGLDVNGLNPKFELSVKDNELHLKLQNGESLLISGKDGSVTMKAGDGAVHVALAEHLETMLWNVLKGQSDSDKTAFSLALAALAADMTALGAAVAIGATSAAAIAAYQGTPGAASVVPAYNAAVTSTKVSVPDG